LNSKPQILRRVHQKKYKQSAITKKSTAHVNEVLKIQKMMKGDAYE